ncbi:3-oxoacyl-ACP reductase FabG [Magnetofaba australis]|uniref:3-oxoacyl-[acyl-carrier-protein] reductase n=1 Tax=Magnetofaba australis IT-1 TaxID=1434232 RepID=A0A1Y2K7F0_9PROT|nr:3-oxoacyl-ACP reductase FabG [Magnetofaba australis]OSM05247.1 putative 3-oxoacyl-ACP reductase [Magnetofaba australis IT-1]
MKDRVALVTGSTRGIGKSIALDLARRGAHVVVSGTNQEKIAQTVAEIEALGVQALGVSADLSQSESAAQLIDAAMGKFGRIDILVNNAGITRDGLMLRMKEDDWEAVLNVNLSSVFRLVKLALKPMMKARFGRIINITSVVGFTGNPGQANYTAAKAGLVGFSRSVAREVAPRGITVNCVAPGFIATDMTEALNDQAREAILSQIPTGAMGSAEDIAGAVAYLAAESTSYVTGETLHVNGGMYMG